VVTLRAHLAVWHPDADVDALLAIVAPARDARAAIRLPARRPPSRVTMPAAIGWSTDRPVRPTVPAAHPRGGYGRPPGTRAS
jgi:hypothetical protein